MARAPQGQPITGLCLALLELGEFIPPAFQPVRRPATGRPGNLRHGSPSANQMEAYLCISRAPGAPLVDVGLVFPEGALVQPMASVKKVLSDTGLMHEGPGPGDAIPLTSPRQGFIGTAGSVEALARDKNKLFNINLSNLPLIGGPRREDVPPGYAVITTSVLDFKCDLSGGSARGAAYICYAKDLFLLDALGDPRSLAKHPRAALLASTGLPPELVFGPPAPVPPASHSSGAAGVAAGSTSSSSSSASASSASPYATSLTWRVPDHDATAEALCHAALAPPILPLWVARQRTARARAAAAADDYTAAHALAPTAAAAAASGAPSAANAASASSAAAAAGSGGGAGAGMRAIGDKMRVGFEKLFGGLGSKSTADIPALAGAQFTGSAGSTTPSASLPSHHEHHPAEEAGSGHHSDSGSVGSRGSRASKGGGRAAAGAAVGLVPGHNSDDDGSQEGGSSTAARRRASKEASVGSLGSNGNTNASSTVPARPRAGSTTGPLRSLKSVKGPALLSASSSVISEHHNSVGDHHPPLHPPSSSSAHSQGHSGHPHHHQHHHHPLHRGSSVGAAGGGGLRGRKSSHGEASVGSTAGGGSGGGSARSRSASAVQHHDDGGSVDLLSLVDGSGVPVTAVTSPAGLMSSPEDGSNGRAGSSGSRGRGRRVRMQQDDVRRQPDSDDDTEEEDGSDGDVTAGGPDQHHQQRDAIDPALLPGSNNGAAGTRRSLRFRSRLGEASAGGGGGDGDDDDDGAASSDAGSSDAEGFESDYASEADDSQDDEEDDEDNETAGGSDSDAPTTPADSANSAVVGVASRRRRRTRFDTRGSSATDVTDVNGSPAAGGSASFSGGGSASAAVAATPGRTRKSLRRLDTLDNLGPQSNQEEMIIITEGGGLNVSSLALGLPSSTTGAVGASGSSSEGGIGAAGGLSSTTSAGSASAGSASASSAAAAADSERAFRNTLMYRLYSWIYSPSATRLAVGSASLHPCPLDGTVSDANCLLSFLVPSPASVAIAPLLRALYVRNGELACASLEGLTAIVDSGFFMSTAAMAHHQQEEKLSQQQQSSSSAPISSTDLSSSARPRLTSDTMDGLVPPLTSEGEHAYLTSCGWGLLDVITAIVCDACHPIVDQVHGQLTSFLTSVLRMAGAGPAASGASAGGGGGLTSSSAHSLFSSTIAPAAAASGPTYSGMPCGLHPSTLARILSTTLGVHTLAQQKRVYAGRGYRYCAARPMMARDAKDFLRRLMAAEQECEAHLNALKTIVSGVMVALERDAAIPLATTLSAAAMAAFATNDGSHSSILVPFSSSFATSSRAPRSTFGDYSGLARVYAAHLGANPSFSADVHSAAQRHIVARPWPALPPELTSHFDSFALPRRSPTADALVLVGILSKIAGESIALAPEPVVATGSGGKAAPVASSAAAAAASSGGYGHAAYKRMTASLVRDTAMHLLAHAFDCAGPAFACSPLLVSSVGRMVAPTLFSHMLSDRLLAGRITICARGRDIFGEDDGGALIGEDASIAGAAANAPAGSGGGHLIPPTSALRAVLHVVTSMWASRGCDAAQGAMAAGSEEELEGDAVTRDAASSKHSHHHIPTSIREACAREISALMRGLVLQVLSSRSAPARLRREALDELSAMIGALPQAVMEFYLNHDLCPGPSALPYPHMRLMRSVVASLVTIVAARYKASLVAAAAAAASTGVGTAGSGADGSPGSNGSGLLPGGTGTGTPALPMVSGGAISVPDVIVVHPDDLPITATPEERRAAWEGWHREELRRSAANLLTTMLRALMDSAATVHLMPPHLQQKQDSEAILVPQALYGGHTAAGGKNSSDVTAVSAGAGGASASSASASASSFNLLLGSSTSSTPPQSGPPHPYFSNGVLVPVRALHARQREAEAAFVASASIFVEKGVKKGLAPLTSAGYVHKSGGSIAHFLRLCGSDLTTDAEVGDYLGDEGRGPEEQALSKTLRHEYLGGFCFAGMAFDMALRIMLTKGGFRLPGEAQKIDRITQAFAVAYYEDNRPTPQMLDKQAAEVKAAATSGGSTASASAAAGGESVHRPAVSISGKASPTAAAGSAAVPVQHSFAMNDGRLFPGSPDVVEILSFSCIMLNTDAHNPSIKKEKKMTRKQFVGNNRGIDKGADLPRQFLEYLYDAIVSNEIKMGLPTPGAAAATSAAAGGGAGAGAGGGDVSVSGSGGGGTPSASSGPLPSLSAALFGPATAICLASGPDSTGETDGTIDGAAFLRHASGSAFRWMNHLHSCAKADDARGAAASRALLAAEASPLPDDNDDGIAAADDAAEDDVSGGKASARSSSSATTRAAAAAVASAVAAASEFAVAPVFLPVPYRRSFGVTTVACALTDLWPLVMRYATVVLRLQPSLPGGTRKPSVPASGRSGSTGTIGRGATSGSGGGARVPALSNLFSFGSGGTASPAGGGGKGAAGANDDASDIPVARLGVCSPGENELRLQAIDTLKYALSACLFLGQSALIAEGADALLQVEAALVGIDAARRSKASIEGWHNVVSCFAKSCATQQELAAAAAAASSAASPSSPNTATNSVPLAVVDPGGAALAISALHLAVATMRDRATSQAEAATVQNTAAQFKGEVGRLLAAGAGSRRLLYEGDLIKVAARGHGKHTSYRFFLFTDMLVYAQRGPFGGKWQAHQRIPLRNLRFERDPPELTSVKVKHGFKLDTEVKALYLIAANELELTEWRRHLREAIDDLARSDEMGPSGGGSSSPLGSFKREASSISALAGGGGAPSPHFSVKPPLVVVAPPATAGASSMVLKAVPSSASLTGTVSSSTSNSSLPIGPAAGGAVDSPKPLMTLAKGESGRFGAQPAVASPAASASAASPPKQVPTSAASTTPGSKAAAPSSSSPAISAEEASPPKPMAAAAAGQSPLRTMSSAASAIGTTTPVTSQQAPSQLSIPLSGLQSSSPAEKHPGPHSAAGAGSSSHSHAGSPSQASRALLSSHEHRAARPELYESIAVLKSAFLAAVTHCRPLLTGGEGGGSGTTTAAGGRGGGGGGASPGPDVTSGQPLPQLSDADKLAFYAYFKQATCGDCPQPAHDDDVSMLTAGAGATATNTSTTTGTPRAAAGGGDDATPRSPVPVMSGSHSSSSQALSPSTSLAVAKAKREAWRRCGGMRRRDAMRAFVMLLDKQVPGWDAGSKKAAAASSSSAGGGGGAGGSHGSAPGDT